MSNGARSVQKDYCWETNYDHFMPEVAYKRTRSIAIYHCHDRIEGFIFFDNDKLSLWQIGVTDSEWGSKKTVMLDENEVIIGVVCKLFSDYQSCYTSF